MIKILSSKTLAKTGTKINQYLFESGKTCKKIIYGKNTSMAKMGVGTVSKRELSDGALQISYLNKNAESIFWYDRLQDGTVRNVVLLGDKIDLIDGKPENKFIKQMISLLKKTH